MFKHSKSFDDPSEIFFKELSYKWGRKNYAFSLVVYLVFGILAVIFVPFMKLAIISFFGGFVINALMYVAYLPLLKYQRRSIDDDKKKKAYFIFDKRMKIYRAIFDFLDCYFSFLLTFGFLLLTPIKISIRGVDVDPSLFVFILYSSTYILLFYGFFTMQKHPNLHTIIRHLFVKRQRAKRIRELRRMREIVREMRKRKAI